MGKVQNKKDRRKYYFKWLFASSAIRSSMRKGGNCTGTGRGGPCLLKFLCCCRVSLGGPADGTNSDQSGQKPKRTVSTIKSLLSFQTPEITSSEQHRAYLFFLMSLIRPFLWTSSNGTDGHGQDILSRDWTQEKWPNDDALLWNSQAAKQRLPSWDIPELIPIGAWEVLC